MPTIEDVAKLAGVSTATVSRVLNGSYKINTARHEKVMRAMNELGYSIPKKLVTADSPIKALVISNIYTKRYTDLIEALEGAASGNSCSFVHKFINNYNVGEDIFPAKGEYDGVIICDIDMEQKTLAALQEICPVVSCRKQFDYKGCVTVSTDDEEAGYDLTRAFFDKGYSRIMFYRSVIGNYEKNIVKYNVFHTPEELVYQRKRYLGYFRACMERGNGIPAEYDFIQYTQFERENANALSADNRLTALLTSNERPEVIITQDYYSIYAIKQTAENLGLTVPGDITLATFDLPAAPGGPAFPQVMQPYDRIADMTLKTLRYMVRGEIDPKSHLSIYLDHTIVGL